MEGEGEEMGRLVAAVSVGRDGLFVLIHIVGHPSSAWGPFSLATDRLMVHLALATDGSTLNMNTYSDRH